MASAPIHIPSFLSGHPELQARFESEARRLITLNQCSGCNLNPLYSKYYRLVLEKTQRKP